MKTQILKADTGSPVVYGELNAPGADKTVMLYMHYDGQPVNPENWDSDPWQPILRDKALESGGVEISWSDLKSPIDGESRIYARSASDDKSPITAMLTALDALNAAEIPLSVNIKFFLEGEEEDSEDLGHDEKLEEISSFMTKIGLDIDYRIVVQHFCLETWALGNRAIVPRQPKTDKVRRIPKYLGCPRK